MTTLEDITNQAQTAINDFVNNPSIDWQQVGIVTVITFTVIIIPFLLFMIHIYRKGKFRAREEEYRLAVPNVLTHHCKMSNVKGISKDTFDFIGGTRWIHYHPDVGDDYIEIDDGSRLDFTGLDAPKDSVITDGCLIVKGIDKDGIARITVMDEKEFKERFERCL